MALDERKHRQEWLGGIREGHSLHAMGDRLAKKYGGANGAPPESGPPADAPPDDVLPPVVVCVGCGMDAMTGKPPAEEAAVDGAVAGAEEGAVLGADEADEADADELESLLAGA